MTTTKKATPRKASTKRATAAKSAAAKAETSKLAKAPGAGKADKPKTAKAPAKKRGPAKKPATAKSPTKTAKPAVPAAPMAKPAVVNAPQPVVVGPPMRKKEIIEAVVARSGLKKRDVKPVLDHLLATMGEGIAEGRELVVPPLGRIKVHRQKTAAKKKIFFAKVHQSMAPTPVKVDPTGDV